MSVAGKEYKRRTYKILRRETWEKQTTGKT